MSCLVGNCRKTCLLVTRHIFQAVNPKGDIDVTGILQKQVNQRFGALVLVESSFKSK